MAVQDLDLEVEENSFLCILGPSGCGKSSTLRMLAGLEHISSGDIFFGDTRVNDLAPKDRNIAMVFENYALYPHKSVFDNIANPLRLRNMSAEEIASRVTRAAAMLQIEHLFDRKPAQLSGGQKQRVAIGRAIVREPRVFLFDEPIAHLDAKLRAHMRGELKHLQRQLRTTTIYVTHDQMEALSMADRIAVMHQGVLQQVGTPDEIYHHPVNEWVAGFVGEPPMNFVDCRLESQGERLYIAHPSFRVPLTAQQARQLNSAASAPDVRLGVRPDDLALSNGSVADPGDGAALGRIFVTEPVGGDTLVDVKLTEEQRLLVRTRAGFDGDSGDPCVIRLNQDRIHLFSRESGVAYF
ncbi:MAG: ABC transporter ATP-binding protein [Pseudomonadota bacterium]|nr:ABC transporter ATP-binding protein [Pseudomonadota bacterium]